MGFEDFGLDYGNPDFVRYTKSYGANGHRVESAATFAPLVQHCLDIAGVHVIDCLVDYPENDRILHQDIKERSAAV